jgi:hypothetical protein
MPQISKIQFCVLQLHNNKVSEHITISKCIPFQISISKCLLHSHLITFFDKDSRSILTWTQTQIKYI